ncbi:MAG: AAA family ATPase [Bacteroidota bacterium]|nr:AAA family ATPase [Bacteroidota bacterium]
MIENFLSKQILTKFPYEPTRDQENLVQKLSGFLHTKSEHSVFLLKGYAGTGKTSLISAFVKSLKDLKINFRLMAPTGRAAKVLSHYSGFPAFTIHKQIYRQKSGGQVFSGFDLNYNKQNNTIFIVDEASMISNEYAPNSMFGSGRLLNDLLQFVFSQAGCSLILIGDTAQLPPVNTDLSPALDETELKAMDMQVTSHELTEVIRQTKASGILMNATDIRKKISTDPESLPELTIQQYTDIERIGGNELVDILESTYDDVGINEVKIICRSNKNANVYNQGVRNQILWREEELSPGDLLMVVKNNYMWLPDKTPIDFIANGDMIEVVRLKKRHDLYGLRFQDAEIRFVDYPELEIEVRLMLDCLEIDGPSLTSKASKALYENVKLDHQHLDGKKRMETMRKDPFLNALQVKYAYAMTCHKSQGGQWHSIFIDQGYVTEEMMGISYYRWLYTALTRATHKVYLVNFPGVFFNQ